jgi:hypothetical protein
MSKRFTDRYQYSVVADPSGMIRNILVQPLVPKRAEIVEKPASAFRFDAPHDTSKSGPPPRRYPETGFEAISLNLTDDMPAAWQAARIADRKRHRNATRLEKYFGYPPHGQRKHSARCECDH